MQPLQITMFSQAPELKRMAKEETPSYRLITLGAPALSYTEVLAVLLGDMANQMEIARAIRDRWPTPFDLQRAQLIDFQAIHGIGPGRALRIPAAFELGRRVQFSDDLEKTVVSSPADAAAYVQYSMGALEQEELWVLLLDVRNRIDKVEKLYKGSVSSSQVRVGEIFKAAVRSNAVNIIIVHNHPSGDPTPSPDDVALTRAIVQAGKLLDIEVLDHLVIGRGRWVSLKERGLGFV